MLRQLQGGLPLKDQLRRFGISSPSRCWCYQDPREEDLNHVFCSGEGARLVWRHFEINASEMREVNTVRHMVWFWWLRRGDNIYLKFLNSVLPSMICWELWRIKNMRVFEGRRMRVRETVSRIVQLLSDIFHVQFPRI